MTKKTRNSSRTAVANKRTKTRIKATQPPPDRGVWKILTQKKQRVRA